MNRPFAIVTGASSGIGQHRKMAEPGSRQKAKA
jgi:hypothetical protein